MDYRVELDDYSGPLDLLLYLIKGEEVDIYDIPIAVIADRYVEYLNSSDAIDVNSVAEFLLMASRLMEIKSRKLVRKPEGEEDEDEEEEEGEDPSAELFRQLLALRAFKEAATLLSELADIRARQYARGGKIELPEEEADEGPPSVEGLSLFDLAERYMSIMRQTGGGGEATIERDQVTVQERTEAILGALTHRPELALEALFEGARSRVVVVGTFFVLLELVWRGEIRVFQREDFGEIFVRRHAQGAEGGEDADETPHAMPHVEPYLPPPVEREIGPDGKPVRVPWRPHFAALERPGGPSDGSSDEDFIATDNFEVRLKARIERILGLADEICERFEAAIKGRPQEPGAEAAGASADLDAELAAFREDLGDDSGGVEGAPAEGEAAKGDPAAGGPEAGDRDASSGTDAGQGGADAGSGIEEGPGPGA